VLDLYIHGNEPMTLVWRARGWVYVALVVLALTAHRQRQRWLDALDRRFFRERYSAHRLLREMAEDVRQSGSFENVAPRVAVQIHAALHPMFVTILVREPREPQYRLAAAAPPAARLERLDAESKLVGLVRVLRKPLELSFDTRWLGQQLPREETEFIEATGIDLLVPVTTAPGHTEALLVLGPKRSEEPYGDEDCDLLMAIAGSLALLLERPAASIIPAEDDTFSECPQCGTCYDSGTLRCAREGSSLVRTGVPRLLAARYRLERRLGRGGMGTVYSAVDTELERQVAVKLLREDLVGSAAAAERFKREARAAASFTHPNVVTVHDFGITDRRNDPDERQAYLVMELLEGRTLRDAIRAEERLAPARAVGILRGVCSAVDAAHRRHLMHRDLKPENIFLLDGETEVAKVLDFGIAKSLSAAVETETRIDTVAGTLIGTPRYMAPEQLRGEEPQPAWDIWALAVIAFEMIAGVHPLAGVAVPALPSDGALGPDPMIRARLGDAPECWHAFFLKALAINPSRRPESARAFSSAFESAILSGDNVVDGHGLA
jgi:serine/threonine-protein kinase